MEGYSVSHTQDSDLPGSDSLKNSSRISTSSDKQFLKGQQLIERSREERLDFRTKVGLLS
jgi:hypothetical protein